MSREASPGRPQAAASSPPRPGGELPADEEGRGRGPDSFDLSELPEQERVEWLRQYNIRRREAEWRQRQDEQISQRHIAWEMDQLAQKRRIAQAREAMKNRVETKRLQDQQAKLRRDYLAQVRDKVIDARETDWYFRSTQRIIEEQAGHRAREEEHETNRLNQKEQARLELQQEAALRAAKKRESDLLMNRRLSMIEQKEKERLDKEVWRLQEYRKQAAIEKAAQRRRDPFQRSVLAAPRRDEAANAPAEAKREQALAQRLLAREIREAARRERLKDDGERQQFAGKTEKALLSGEMSVFWYPVKIEDDEDKYVGDTYNNTYEDDAEDEGP